MTDRAVLISIKPKYCELIASGKKTVEVRKTRPKIPTPFKGYIYCTKGETVYLPRDIFGNEALNGKVIGEFVCDGIASLKCDNGYHAAFNRHHNTCLTDDEIIKYANNGTAHYLNITNIKIYDTPKELSEFGLKRAPQSWCYVQEGK